MSFLEVCVGHPLVGHAELVPLKTLRTVIVSASGWLHPRLLVQVVTCRGDETVILEVVG